MPEENEVILNTLDIQEKSLTTFMESLGYQLVSSNNKLVFFSGFAENKAQRVISYGNAVRLHNSMYNVLDRDDTENGYVKIYGFRFPSYFYQRARSSQLVAEVGLHYTKQEDDFEIMTSKDFVYFVNEAEYLMGNKIFMKEDAYV